MTLSISIQNLLLLILEKIKLCLPPDRRHCSLRLRNFFPRPKGQQDNRFVEERFQSEFPIQCLVNTKHRFDSK